MVGDVCSISYIVTERDRLTDKERGIHTDRHTVRETDRERKKERETERGTNESDYINAYMSLLL